MIKCQECGKEFVGEIRRKFCSKSCAAIFTRKKNKVAKNNHSWHNPNTFGVYILNDKTDSRR